MHLTIKELKQLCNTASDTEVTEDGRKLLLNYILYNKGVFVPHTMTAQVTNITSYQKNLKLTKQYFKSFTDE